MYPFSLIHSDRPRRTLLMAAAVAAVSFAGLAHAQPQAAVSPSVAPLAANPTASARRPNVVFILADDLGWADTAIYGSTFYETPNIDALARRGVRFSNAYAANPLCSPTRASILSGQYPARLGLTQAQGAAEEVRLSANVRGRAQPFRKLIPPQSATRLPLEHITLAERLKAEGYATGHFGKWHLGREPFDARAQGFDVDVPHYWGPNSAGGYIAPWKFPDANFQGKPGDHIEDRMAAEATKFIRANKDKPFFLNYWSFSVHGPWAGKPEYIAKYKAKADPNNPQHNPVYGAMVQSLDDAVGTLTKAITDAGIADNTIIVFTSDNGGQTTVEVDGMPVTSNAPLRSGKASIYEGGTREPLIVAWPGQVKPDTRSDALVSSVDFYPTLLDLTDVKPDPAQKLDGQSVAGAIKGTGPGRDSVFGFFPHQTKSEGGLPAASVRKGDWKLIRFFGEGAGGRDLTVLYDLASDIGERNDVSAAQPNRVKELSVLLDGYLADTHAVLPVVNPAYDPTAVAPPAGKKKRQSIEAGEDQ
ncbi:MAG TPA: sulfatase [Tepidisphaeraceae bacterium]|jgi:arylsulfatase A-like enzyme